MGNSRSSSLVINDKGIFVKDGEQKMSVTKDGFIIKSGDDLIEINEDGIFADSKHFNNRTMSNICIDNDCIKFDCNERIKMRGDKIYCGDRLYYEYANHEFVNRRS